MKTAVIEPTVAAIERGWTMADLARTREGPAHVSRLAHDRGWLLRRAGRDRWILLALFHAVFGTALAAGGSRGAQSMVGAPVRRHHAADTDAPDSCGPDVSARGFDRRDGPWRWRSHLPGRCRELDQRASGRGHHRHLPFRLHAAEANQHDEHAGRRDPGCVAAADRLGGGAERSRSASLDVSLRFCFSGNCRTFSPSAGCIAKIMRAPVSSCSPGSDEEGERTGRQSVFFTMLLLVASVTPVWSGIASLLYLPIALSLGAAFPCARFSLSTAQESADGAAFVFRLHHLPAASPRCTGFDQTMSDASVSHQPGHHSRPAPSPGKPPSS